ncbi:CDP-alcohol phosphatidyltransferase family protein [Dongia sedimenti]|uniref:CDP-alcohol phosphatidyltransferase family protein n=1 Tax=Dongia sedimenti TaxID=3064282 RepID=A0ABU0YTA9_9PROT|nr:CDP-alcohol phosphatidyltransferase family protein [Rhodospirillaceae bacterium R-7]
MIDTKIRYWIVEAITISRLVAALLFASIAFQSLPLMLVVGLYVTAAASDLADGFLARRFKVVSNFGRAFDLVSDKSLTIVSLLYAAARGVDLLPLSIIGTREIIMIGARMITVSGTPLFPTSRFFGGVFSFLVWGNTVLLILCHKHDDIFLIANLIYWLCAILGAANALYRIKSSAHRIRVASEFDQ